MQKKRISKKHKFDSVLHLIDDTKNNNMNKRESQVFCSIIHLKSFYALNVTQERAFLPSVLTLKDHFRKEKEL